MYRERNDDLSDYSEEEEDIAPFALTQSFEVSSSELTNLNTPTTKIGIDSSSNTMIMDDSIIAAALEDVSEEMNSCGKDSTVDFSKLMQEADNTQHSNPEVYIPRLNRVENMTDSFQSSEANFKKRPQVKVLGKDTFSVEIYIPQTTTRAAMESASNPDLLRVWCQTVVNVFVTKDSGKTDNSMVKKYDGEWIEAAATLRVPPGYTLYNLFFAAKTYLGFSTHGKISLFIEKKRGTLTLTIEHNSIGGVSHSMTFLQQRRGVLLKSVVRLQPAEKICFVCPPFQKYFCPSLQKHMEQTIRSMEDLKLLVEQGETAAQRISLDDSGVTPLLGGPMI